MITSQKSRFSDWKLLTFSCDRDKQYINEARQTGLEIMLVIMITTDVYIQETSTVSFHDGLPAWSQS